MIIKNFGIWHISMEYNVEKKKIYTAGHIFACFDMFLREQLALILIYAF